MKIGIACDHAGFTHKENLKNYLKEKGIEVNDFGCYTEESVDYPDFAHELAKSIQIKKNDFGIQFCGTGNGINMSANKHKGIRSALCWNAHIAEQSRLHNNANILSIPARFIKKEDALEIVRIFLETEFEGGRHKKRINKINKCL